MVDSSFLQHEVGVLLLAGFADHPAVHALREGAPGGGCEWGVRGGVGRRVEKMGC